MKITNRLADAFIEHINELSREEQADSLRAAMGSFKFNKAKFRVLDALRKRKDDISDMKESYRAMP
jgi:hypothetical protein